MKNKLEHIVALAYTSRCQYDAHESIEREIRDLIYIHNLKVSFWVCTTGVEFTEEIFTWGMSGELAQHTDTKVYFINY